MRARWLRAVGAAESSVTMSKRLSIRRTISLNAQMMQTEDKQISLTDPDARSMATSGRGSGIVGYNVQTAVDTKNHLIECPDDADGRQANLFDGPRCALDGYERSGQRNRRLQCPNGCRYEEPSH